MCWPLNHLFLQCLYSPGRVRQTRIARNREVGPKHLRTVVYTRKAGRRLRLPIWIWSHGDKFFETLNDISDRFHGGGVDGLAVIDTGWQDGVDRRLCHVTSRSVHDISHCSCSPTSGRVHHIAHHPLCMQDLSKVWGLAPGASDFGLQDSGLKVSREI